MKNRTVYNVHQHFPGMPVRRMRKLAKPSGTATPPAKPIASAPPPTCCRCSGSGPAKALPAASEPIDVWGEDDDEQPQIPTKLGPALPASCAKVEEKTPIGCSALLTHVYPRLIKEPETYEAKCLLRRVSEALGYLLRMVGRLCKACMPKINLGIGVNLFRINGG